MAVNLHVPSPETILAISGVKIGITEANIRKLNRKDLTVFSLAPGCQVAGVFTQNRFRAAPVQLSEAHLASGHDIRALVINTGNANAGTGEQGRLDAQTTCEALAQQLNIQAQQVLPFSTGVIMENLPMDKLLSGLPKAVSDLADNHWFNAAHSIMTTDTLPKIVSKQMLIDAHTIHITGISKGAGMIKPNMATMLGFLATDVGMSAPLLKKLTLEIANQSFNRITVDGDTSTNDSFIVIATGASGLHIDSEHHPKYDTIKAELTTAAKTLAQLIVRDAEGATKFISIHIKGASTESEALKVAYAIAHSPLVKTAFYASDPNLGRILAAIGYAGIQDLDPAKINLWLDDVWVSTQGGRHPAYQEADGQRVMKQAEIAVTVDLGRGDISDTVYTCDFSHDYVTINADYRS